jgi:hypothetical protein
LTKFTQHRGTLRQFQTTEHGEGESSGAWNVGGDLGAEVNHIDVKSVKSAGLRNDSGADEDQDGYTVDVLLDPEPHAVDHAVEVARRRPPRYCLPS